jgi:hypothetical protein
VKQSTTLRISVLRQLTPVRIYISKQPGFLSLTKSSKDDILNQQPEKPQLQAKNNRRELSLQNQQNCKMNETQHIIYERLFICSTSATHQHIHKNI